jgi:hypothetical protein
VEHVKVLRGRGRATGNAMSGLRLEKRQAVLEKCLCGRGKRNFGPIRKRSLVRRRSRGEGEIAVVSCPVYAGEFDASFV